MVPITQGLVVLAAALHVLFFLMESVFFTNARIWQRFGIASQAEADIVRPMAYNQGFYNLFLAAGAIVGLVFVNTGSVSAGIAVVIFATACMALAGLVLISTGRRFLPAAAIQFTPPFLALVLIALR